VGLSSLAVAVAGVWAGWLVDGRPEVWEGDHIAATRTESVAVLSIVEILASIFVVLF